MTERKKCDWIGCHKSANAKTGNCDLHDAIAMATDALDLLFKALNALNRLALKDREVDHD